MNDKEAEALMADIGYAKHSDCRELVQTAYGMGYAAAMKELKPVTVHLPTGNLKLDAAWKKIEGFNREAQLKQVFEWVKTGHLNTVEFNVLVGRVQ